MSGSLFQTFLWFLTPFSKRNPNILTAVGSNGSVDLRIIISFVKSKKITFAIILTSMDSSKNSVTISTKSLITQPTLPLHSEAIEMILAPEGPDDEDLEDEK